ncbi:MAG: DUF378 domain-containing protein [Oscillospiraceae bacterium]|nr:DUF378 domain-containing protein [Oscillospiraceae bacterium]
MVTVMDKIALCLLVIGGLNWGLVGIFDFDLIAWAFGSGAVISRILYILVAVAALWCISLLFRRTESMSAEASH